MLYKANRLAKLGGKGCNEMGVSNGQSVIVPRASRRYVITAHILVTEIEKVAAAMASSSAWGRRRAAD